MHTRVRDTNTAPRSLEPLDVSARADTRSRGFFPVYVQLLAVHAPLGPGIEIALSNVDERVIARHITTENY